MLLEAAREVQVPTEACGGGVQGVGYESLLSHQGGPF